MQGDEVHADVVIVGTGHGGAQSAIALRQHGFAGTILMIGAERDPPYERPPLSKDYLAREKAFDRLLIRPPAFWEDKAIVMRLGATVTGIDAEARRATLKDGGHVSYGTLIWAGGGAARRLTCPGGALAGVHSLRGRENADALIAALDHGARQVVVIGGGYIGLEAAAVLTKLGCEVTLLEAQPRILARVAGEALSAFYTDEHRAHGVDIHTHASVVALEGDARVTGVRLADGTVLPAAMVIVGIGIVPEVAPLLAAGAEAGAGGVRVDAYCRTALPHIYAIGDCAAFTCDFAEGAVVRIESVQNAHDQASLVARTICGDPQPYHALPWFWSNQYDLKLQTIGLSLGHDASVLRGDPATRSFSVVYLRQGRVIALDCVNKVRDYAQGRKLIEAGTCPDPRHLADPDIALKELV